MAVANPSQSPIFERRGTGVIDTAGRNKPRILRQAPWRLPESFHLERGIRSIQSRFARTPGHSVAMMLYTQVSRSDPCGAS